ncbi:MAG: cell wall hydrolase [Clostridium sp.]|nr:cell wall hydrolase [Clostridium sp.]
MKNRRKRRDAIVSICAIGVIAITATVIVSATKQADKPKREATESAPPTYATASPTVTPEATTPRPIGTPQPTPTPQLPYTESDVIMLAQTVWGEARGCAPEEQRLVVWTILQRVDADEWGDTIEAVITARGQFAGYDKGFPIEPEIYALCAEEAAKWANGEAPPILAPYATAAPYYFFDGDGRHNWYREGWR